jgi:hypothetical protein
MHKCLTNSFLLAFLSVATIACDQNETSYIVDLCDIKEQGSTLYLFSDGGATLYPSSSLDVATYKAGQRFRVTYVKLEGNSLSGEESMVEIKDMLPVLIKDVVTPGSFTDRLADPLWLVGKPWFGGSYLNFEFTYGYSEDSDIKHSIQLVQDSVSRRKAYMTFGHNANGDAYDKKVTALASFPLSTFPERSNVDSLVIRVKEGSKNKTYRLAVK